MEVTTIPISSKADIIMRMESILVKEHITETRRQTTGTILMDNSNQEDITMEKVINLINVWINA